MRKKVSRALARFLTGFNCAQSILSIYGPKYGVNQKRALKLATGFGSGIAQMGDICGAVAGSLMVIGLKYGRSKINDRESKPLTYELIRKFIDRFEERNKTIKCKELIGCDLDTAEGRKHAEAHNLFHTVCPKLVQDAAEILEEILLEN